MNIAEILGKVAKGEALTDDEKKALAEYNPQKAIDDAAAAARRKAEQERDQAAKALADVQAKVAEMESALEEAGNKGKSELEKTQALLEKTSTRLAEAEKNAAALAGEKAKMVRGQTLGKIISGSGITFVKEVDGELMRGVLESRFADIPDAELGNEAVIKPILDGFKKTNSAIIADTSGGGSGNPPKGNVTPAPPAKPVDQMTTDERAAQLRGQLYGQTTVVKKT